MSNRPLSVCYFGTYRADYSRNQIMIEGLRRNQVVVLECQEALWHGIEDRVQVASGGWWRPRFWWRLLNAYWRLFWRHAHLPDYDVMVVGYPGQLDVFLARLLSWWRHKPLAWDIFMSIYLIALERGLDKRSRLSINLLRWLEWAALRLPDRLVIDTSEYATWLQTTHGLSADRFCLVPTGADDRIFKPFPNAELDRRYFYVIYYGSFIPNHGVNYIIEAARILANEPTIHFELIGDGPDKESACRLAQDYGLSNITFSNWLDQAELIQHIARANVCLGAFGMTPQSMMTVQNKVYEGLAMAKPVITGDASAIHRTLEHGEQVYLVPRADSVALSQAIQILRIHPSFSARLAEAGFRRFQEAFTLAAIGHQMRVHLEQVDRS